jgi:hypothetical protein
MVTLQLDGNQPIEPEDDEPMLLHEEEWMDLRAYRALKDAGATWAEIARESGHDWRTVKRYLGPTPRRARPDRHPGRRSPS